MLWTLSVNGQIYTIYVSPKGNDNNSGTVDKPIKTLQKALSLMNTDTGENVSIQLMKGTYYLTETINIDQSLPLPARLEIQGFENHRVVIRAAQILKPDWTYFREGIYRTQVPAGMSFERLYVNGKLQTLARYPNSDSTAKVFNGTAQDATYYMRVLTWGNPSGGYVHALDENKKGSLHYRITGVDDTDNVELDGGWQYKYPVHMHESYRFVENLLGELDAPGEWYLDKDLNFLYYYPVSETDLSKALIEVSNLKNSIVVKGTPGKPVKNLTFKNLHFEYNERTFMDSKDMLAGSDWAVYRGGALTISDTENCKIKDCTFTDLGGNAIVIDGYNKNVSVSGCLISHIGGSGFTFIDNSSDSASGHLRKRFVPNCIIENNLFQYVGEIEKQGSGIHLNGVAGVTLKNNTIFHTPGNGLKIENCNLENIKNQDNEVIDQNRELDGKPHEHTGAGVQLPALRKLIGNLK